MGLMGIKIGFPEPLSAPVLFARSLDSNSYGEEFLPFQLTTA